jgi:hypothetical protein
MRFGTTIAFLCILIVLRAEDPLEAPDSSMDSYDFAFVREPMLLLRAFTNLKMVRGHLNHSLPRLLFS